MFSIMIILTALAEWARGLDMKLPSAILLGLTFAFLSFLGMSDLNPSLLAGVIVAGGFYISAMTTPRPLFGALHGKVDPSEWKINPANKWLFACTQVFVKPSDGYTFGIIYGAFRGLYLLPTSCGLAAVYGNPLLVLFGLLGTCQGICYRLAGIILPNNQYNPALARFIWGLAYGVVLWLSLVYRQAGISAES